MKNNFPILYLLLISLSLISCLRKYSVDASNYPLNGNYTINSADGSTYSGQFKDDLYDGEGVLELSDGTSYTGTFSKGSFVQGTADYGNGRSYTGSFLNNQWDGKGYLGEADGSFYLGQFTNGKFNGFGEYYDANTKTSIFSVFSNNLAIGETFVAPLGKEVEFQFRDSNGKDKTEEILSKKANIAFENFKTKELEPNNETIKNYTSQLSEKKKIYNSGGKLSESEIKKVIENCECVMNIYQSKESGKFNISEFVGKPYFNPKEYQGFTFSITGNKSQLSIGGIPINSNIKNRVYCYLPFSDFYNLNTFEKIKSISNNYGSFYNHYWHHNSYIEYGVKENTAYTCFGYSYSADNKYFYWMKDWADNFDQCIDAMYQANQKLMDPNELMMYINSLNQKIANEKNLLAIKEQEILKNQLAFELEEKIKIETFYLNQAKKIQLQEYDRKQKCLQGTKTCGCEKYIKKPCKTSQSKGTCACAI